MLDCTCQKKKVMHCHFCQEIGFALFVSLKICFSLISVYKDLSSFFILMSLKWCFMLILWCMGTDTVWVWYEYGDTMFFKNLGYDTSGIPDTCINNLLNIFYLYVLYIGFNVEYLPSYLLFTLLDLGLYSKHHLMAMDSLYYPLSYPKFFKKHCIPVPILYPYSSRTHAS